MASFDFNVDTSPMANSIDNTRGSVNGVTAAVVAMQAAVIASEIAASKKICQNVDEGFYMLVKSQISQKAVAAYTEMSSKHMTLMQLAKAIDNSKRVMENDYNMITKRYTKLFNSLNKALDIRVKELDRPALHLAETKKRIVFDKLKDDSSSILSISSETVPIAQTALNSKLKQKTKETLNVMSDSINEDRIYNEKVESILVKDGADSSSDSNTHYVPAALLVSDSLLNKTDDIESIFTVKNDMWQNTAPIESEVSRVNKELQWSSSDAEEKKLIRKEFITLCEKSRTDERVVKEIIRLFDESAWEDCK